MPTTALTPEELDAQAARLHDTDAWQQIVTGWDLTVPAAAPEAAPAAARPVAPPQPTAPAEAHPVPPAERSPVAPQTAPPGDWRALLSVPVDQLITDTVRALPPAAPRTRPLPGRIGAMLPDRLHTWRRIGQTEVRPSVHLAHARQILTEWAGRTPRTGCAMSGAHAASAVPCSPRTVSATARRTRSTGPAPGSSPNCAPRAGPG